MSHDYGRHAAPTELVPFSMMMVSTWRAYGAEALTPGLRLFQLAMQGQRGAPSR